MESAATRLQKEAKGYLDSLRGGWTSFHLYSAKSEGNVRPLTIVGQPETP